MQYALAGAKRAGAEVDAINLHTLKLPVFEESLEVGPETPEVQTLLAKARAADALIFASPVYHGTISGALKNCIDFFEFLGSDDPPYLTNKVIGLITVSGGIPNSAALDPFYHIARALNCWVLPLAVLVPGSAFDERQQLVDQQLSARLVTLGQRLTEASQKWTA